MPEVDWDINWWTSIEGAPWCMITSLEEYERCICMTQAQRKNSRVIKLEAFRDSLKDHEEDITDPVLYLHELYFNQKYSFEDIWKLTRQRWLDFASSNWLHKLITDFWWDHRETTDYIYDTWANTSGLSPLNSANKKLMQETRAAFEFALSEELESVEWIETQWNIDLKIYNKLRYPKDKVFYILWLKENITEAMILKIYNDPENSLGAPSITKFLNEKVRRTIQDMELDIEIPELNANSIWNWLRRESQKLK